MLLMFDVKVFLEILASSHFSFCCVPTVCVSTLWNAADVGLEPYAWSRWRLGCVGQIFNASFNVYNVQPCL